MPMRGFAVTVGIGIVTTVFVAFTLTRWLAWRWVRLAADHPSAAQRPHWPVRRPVPAASWRFATTPLPDGASFPLAVALAGGAERPQPRHRFHRRRCCQVQVGRALADAAAIAARLEEANLGDVAVRSGRDPATGHGPHSAAGRRERRADLGIGRARRARYSILTSAGSRSSAPPSPGDLISPATIGMAIRARGLDRLHLDPFRVGSSRSAR